MRISPLPLINKYEPISVKLEEKKFFMQKRELERSILRKRNRSIHGIPFEDKILSQSPREFSKQSDFDSPVKVKAIHSQPQQQYIRKKSPQKKAQCKIKIWHKSDNKYKNHPINN